MWFKIILGVVSGLGLFIYGMMIMSSGLQKTAGNKLKSIIKALTINRFMAVIVGMVVTMIIQSSSATSVMVVGFVNAGIMKLTQAVGVILGANIGTTITSQLIALDLVKIAPVFVAIGVFLQMTKKQIKIKNTAEILIGFGILFIGMGMLKGALKPLQTFPEFKEMLVTYGSHPVLGIIIGFLLTLILQSSSATMGILIALAGVGLIPFNAALYIIYGENIGTCTTALISSIGSSRKAKQVAVMHLSFNIIGTALFMLLLNGPLTKAVYFLNSTSVPAQIAHAHTIFNITNVIIMFPFAPLLIKLAELLVPDTDEESKGQQLYHLDERILATPSIAIKNTMQELVNMAEKTKDALNSSIDALLKQDKDNVMETFENESIVNSYQKKIMEYLNEISKTEISDSDKDVILNMYKIVNDIERIGDHSENIAELAGECIDKEIKFDDKTIEDMKFVIDKVLIGYYKTIEAMKLNETNPEEIMAIEKELDYLKESSRLSHIERMNKNHSSVESGIIYLDLLSNLERVSDHCKKIALSVKDINE